MISMAQSSTQRDPIVFTGEWVESSRIVKMALDIIYTLEMEDLDETSARTYMYVVDFAKKWDIDLISNVIGKAVRRALKVKGCASLELLLLSLKLNNNDLASLSFAADGQEWPEDAEDGSEPGPHTDSAGLDRQSSTRLPLNYQSECFPCFPGGEISFGGPTLDLGASWHQDFLQIPPTIVWIILKSQHLAAHDKTPAKDHFKRLMDNACKHPARCGR
jgi:hypothetical protein